MSRLITQAQFVEASIRTHGDGYNYSRAAYVDSKTKVTIVCNTCGSEFAQTPNAHIRGQGCVVCSRKKAAKRYSDTTESFVAKAAIVHGGVYTYESTVYVATHTKVSITCPAHGRFMQTPNSHLKGAGCPMCWAKRRAVPQVSQADCMARCVTAHDGLYTYEKAYYTGMHDKFEVTCRTHGGFLVSPSNHLQGSGCPSCGVRASQHEVNIVRLIESHGVAATKNFRPKWMQGKELDIFMPELNLAIEYCGYHVHNSTRNKLGGKPKEDMYHYDKWKLCRDNGVTLLTIYDFEWFASREKWEAVIRHKLQKADRRVYARKCQIVSVERAVAYQFCKDHHIESAGGAWTYQALCLGLEYQGELVAVMVEDKGDIKRSCTLSGTAVIGGVSRLFKAFPAGTTMMTTNNTGSSGNYGTLLDKKTTRYWWVKGTKVLEALPRHRCQKHMLEKRFGIPVGEKTERQYMEDLGYVRCYDSGLSYWVNR